MPAPSALVAVLAAGPQVNLTWSGAGIGDETGFSVQRRDVSAGGAFAEVHASAADAVSWAGDLGPFTAGHMYQYRIVVVGGASDGLASNVVDTYPAKLSYQAQPVREGPNIPIELGIGF